MAATNEKVLAMVGRELEKNKDVSNQELFEKATKMDSSIGRLTPRQFHARYPLQWKRAKAAGTPAKPATRTAQPKRAARKPAAQTGKRSPGRPRKRAAGATTAATTTPAATTRAATPRATTTTRAATRATRPTRSATPAAASVEPAGIRRIMLQFASDVAGAESRRDLVKVLADVDKYVDRVAKAAEAR